MMRFNQTKDSVFENFQSITLLMIRIMMAVMFFEPAMKKWQDIEGTAIWFESLQIPAPMVAAYIVASSEIAGVILLSIGLMTRYISLILTIIMMVAIATVHIQNGFSASVNGFEIPMYYMFFLMILITFGAGKVSIDQMLKKRDTSPTK